MSYSTNWTYNVYQDYMKFHSFHQFHDWFYCILVINIRIYFGYLRNSTWYRSFGEYLFNTLCQNSRKLSTLQSSFTKSNITKCNINSSYRISQKIKSQIIYLYFHRKKIRWNLCKSCKKLVYFQSGSNTAFDFESQKNKTLNIMQDK